MLSLNKVLERMWRNRNFCALLVGMYNDANAVESRVELPGK